MDHARTRSRLLAYFNSAAAWAIIPTRSGLAAADRAGRPMSTAVRHYAWRPGLAVNAEQDSQRTSSGRFLRRSASTTAARKRYEFTEINRSAAAGFRVKPARAGARQRRRLGFAGVVNGISQDARDYFAAGGIGTLIGDGALPRYGTEKIIETYYKAAIVDGFAASRRLTSMSRTRPTTPCAARSRSSASRLHAEF